MLYFLMQDLQAVSHMYQLALSIYTRLFMQTLALLLGLLGLLLGGL